MGKIIDFLDPFVETFFTCFFVYAMMIFDDSSLDVT